MSQHRRHFRQHKGFFFFQFFVEFIKRCEYVFAIGIKIAEHFFQDHFQRGKGDDNQKRRHDYARERRCTGAEKQRNKIKDNRAGNSTDEDYQGTGKKIMQFVELRVGDDQKNKIKKRGPNKSGYWRERIT